MDEKTRGYIIEQLRKCATIPGKEKTWASKLDDKQIFNLFIKLRNGESARAIAKHVADNWQIHTTASLHGIAQNVLKFKRRATHLLIAPLQKTNVASQYNTISDSGFHSSLESLESLAGNLERRIGDIMQQEKETGIRFPLSKEISALSTLKKMILKEKQFELMHTGNDPLLLRKKIKEEDRFKRTFDAFVDSLPDEGKNIIAAGQRFIELVEENAVALNYNHLTGKLEPIENNEAEQRPTGS
jgi:hypothetical protein